MKWAFSNQPLQVNKDFSLIEHNKVFFYSEKSNFFKEYENGLKIAIDGYVLPGFDNFELYKDLDQYQLIYTLFRKKGVNFIQYLKGVFNLVLIDGDIVQVYNDRHSIKKFFIYSKSGNYLVSNDLSIISQNGNLTVSKRNAAVFTLMEHFIDGVTLFNEVVFSKPATRLSINNMMKIEHYWYSDNLLDMEIKDIGFDYFAFKWKTIINQYIDYLKPEKITMTLTGGNDTRMILAALLNIGIKPNVFTFGNSESSDGVVAKKIVDKLGVNYNNYFVANPTSGWFKSKADKIIPLGNSLINVHRAHRLDAVEQEIMNNPGNEMIFGGFMGGDYIKGISYDDYITARLVRLWEFDKRDKTSLIKEELEKKYFNFSETDIEELISFFEKQKFFLAEKKIERQFQFLYNVVGAVHDVQDTNIFGSKIKYTVNPYMDRDFLEMLFSSRYSMMFRQNDDRRHLKKLFQPLLYCKVTDLLCSELSDIEFTKKGFYTPAEFLGNKFVYIIKRVYRYYKSSKFPANFPYGGWIKNYSIAEMNHLESTIKGIFKIPGVKERLNDDLHHFTEGYWHKFTNIINLNKITAFYKKGDGFPNL